MMPCAAGCGILLGIFRKLHTVLGSCISALACSAVYMLCWICAAALTPNNTK